MKFSKKHIKVLSVSSSSDIYLHGKTQDDVYVFLLEVPLIKNS